MIRIFSAAVICVLCAACASNGDDRSPPAPATNTASKTSLDAQTLASGECGLFLWTLAEPRSFVFFSKAGSESALVLLNGEAVRMPQTDADGDLFGQFMTDMRYVLSGGDSTLSVFIQPGDQLEQGQRTQTARLTFTDAEGWETIVPVAGVRACQSE